MSSKKVVQKWLRSSLDDPLVKILAKNSNLTITQIETLLIDVLAENIAQTSLKYEEKGRLRLAKPGVSRGAFNRTLKQARTNVIQAIYTILLLGCLGFFEGTSLDQYLEVAHKLRTYMNTYRDILSTRDSTGEHLTIIKMLRDEIRTSLETLAKPKSMSKKM